jgi:plastocyanin
MEGKMNYSKLAGLFVGITIFLVACSPSATELTHTEEPTVVDLPTEIPATKVESEIPTDQVLIMVQDSRFTDKSITVPVGTTIVWRYDANLPHTVTADDDSFDSGTMRDGDEFTLTFTDVGEYPYYCRFHGGPGGQGMSGTVIVTGG